MVPIIEGARPKLGRLGDGHQLLLTLDDGAEGRRRCSEEPVDDHDRHDAAEQSATEADRDTT